jgi:hypothetical protein
MVRLSIENDWKYSIHTSDLFFLYVSDLEELSGQNEKGLIRGVTYTSTVPFFNPSCSLLKSTLAQLTDEQDHMLSASGSFHCDYISATIVETKQRHLCSNMGELVPGFYSMYLFLDGLSHRKIRLMKATRNLKISKNIDLRSVKGLCGRCLYLSEDPSLPMTPYSPPLHTVYVYTLYLFTQGGGGANQRNG